MRKIFCSSTLVFLTVACASKQVNKPVVAAGVKVPSWVVNLKPGCAAGTYKMKGDLSMAMDASAHHARHQLSQQLQSMTKSLIQKYVEEGEYNSESFTENLTRSVSQSVTSITLSGAIPVRQDVSGDHYFTLVCLNPETFINSFNEMNQLEEKIRVDLRNRARKAFDQLEARTKR